MKSLKLFVAIFIVSVNAFSQSTFIKVFSDADITDSLQGIHIVQTADNNYSFLCTNTYNNVIIRLNTDGNEMHRFEVGPHPGLEPRCLAVNDHFEHLIVGQDHLYNTAYWMRTDSSGTISNFVTQLYGAVGTTIGGAVYHTPDDYFALQIWEDDEMCYNPQIISKIDNANHVIWANDISPNAYSLSKQSVCFYTGDRFSSISLRVVNCYDQFPSVESVLKTDSAYDHLANTSLIPLYSNIDTCLGGGFLLSNLSIFTRLDANNGMLWSKPLPFSSTSTNFALKQMSDSSIYLAGQADIPGFGSQIVLCKTDVQGVLLWTKYFGGNRNEYFGNLIFTNDGGIMICGTTYEFGERKAMIIKTDSSGNVAQNFPTISAQSFHICTNDSTQLTLPAGNSYLWNTGDTLQTLIVTTAGDYFATITDSLGVQINTDTITINQISTVPIILGSDTVYCGSTPLVLSAPTGFLSYEWNTGTQNIYDTAYASGIYVVTAIDSNYCSSFDSINVDIQSLPPFTLGRDTILCTNDTVLLAAPLINQWTWGDGSNDSAFAVTQTGFYSITYTNGICTNNDSIHLVIHPAAVVDLISDTLICYFDSLLLDAGPGFISYMWQDSSVSQTFNASVTNPGTIYYSVAVVDANGCTAFDDVVIDFDICSSVDENSLRNIRIYPTLLSQQKIISVESDRPMNTTISLLNSIGKEIVRLNSQTLPTKIEINDLAGGIYFIRVTNDDGAWSITKRIMVN